MKLFPHHSNLPLAPADESGDLPHRFPLVKKLDQVLVSGPPALLAAAMDVVGDGVQGTTVSLVFGVAIILAAGSGWLAGRIADIYGVDAVFLYAAFPAGAAFALTLVLPSRTATEARV